MGVFFDIAACDVQGLVEVAGEVYDHAEGIDGCGEFGLSGIIRGGDYCNSFAQGLHDIKIIGKGPYLPRS
jgi:hypothetical protein